MIQVLDRSKVLPICQPGSLEASDPSAAISAPISDQDAANAANARRESESNANNTRYNRSYMWNQNSSEVCTVRDVSWHSSEPAMMSTAWDGPDGQHGSIAKHVSVCLVGGKEREAKRGPRAI